MMVYPNDRYPIIGSLYGTRYISKTVLEIPESSNGSYSYSLFSIICRRFRGVNFVVVGFSLLIPDSYKVYCCYHDCLMLTSNNIDD